MDPPHEGFQLEVIGESFHKLGYIQNFDLMLSVFEF